uniref:CTD39 n=1 Tax=Heliconius melpomene TaxID=34740 RepID=A0A2H4RMQ4_HELME|nr:CTD39 [Heliconius melpomene]
MPHDYKQDLVAIKEWMSKESHIPEDIGLEDHLLMRFLHSCYFSLEATKRCIDKFCVTRAHMSEVYNARDPLLPNIKQMLDHSFVGTYPFDGKEMIIFKYDDPATENFNFYDFLKIISIHNDVWVKHYPHFADEHYIIIDMSWISLKMIPKINIQYLKDFIVYLLESMPVRVKKVVGINAPSYYEKIYGLIKSILPAEVIEIIHIYTNVESLHQFVDKKYLPIEYGGEAISLVEFDRGQRQQIVDFRKFYLNDNAWKADLLKKPKQKNVDNSMNGSFRTLAID